MFMVDLIDNVSLMGHLLHLVLKASCLLKGASQYSVSFHLPNESTIKVCPFPL